MAKAKAPEKVIGDLFLATFTQYKESKVAITALLAKDFKDVVKKVTGAASTPELLVTVPAQIVTTGFTALGKVIPVAGDLVAWVGKTAVSGLADKIKVKIARRVTQLPAGAVPENSAVNYDTLNEVEAALTRLREHIPAFNLNQKAYLAKRAEVENLSNPTQEVLQARLIELFIAWHHVYVSGVRIITDIVGVESQLQSISDLASSDFAAFIGSHGQELQDACVKLISGK